MDSDTEVSSPDEDEFPMDSWDDRMLNKYLADQERAINKLEKAVEARTVPAIVQLQRYWNCYMFHKMDSLE